MGRLAAMQPEASRGCGRAWERLAAQAAISRSFVFRPTSRTVPKALRHDRVHIISNKAKQDAARVCTSPGRTKSRHFAPISAVFEATRSSATYTMKLDCRCRGSRAVGKAQLRNRTQAIQVGRHHRQYRVDPIEHPVATRPSRLWIADQLCARRLQHRPLPAALRHPADQQGHRHAGAALPGTATSRW